MTQSNTDPAIGGAQAAGSNGAGDPSTNGHSPFPDEGGTEVQAQAILEKRRKQWKARRYDVAVLDGLTARWAHTVAYIVDRTNAERDPERKPPDLMFAGDVAVKAGATDDELTALTPLTNDEIAALKVRAAAVRECSRSEVRRAAKSMAAQGTRRPLSEAIRLVKDMTLDTPTASIVDGLLYAETVTSWVGDGGTYKTFTVLGLACSVASGRDFTHQLRVPERRPVLFLCAERRRFGLSGDIGAWCSYNHVPIDSLEFHAWDDVVQLGDDEWMAELTEYVTQHGIELVVFDTQRKATRGLEENSSTDMGAALANAATLAKKAKAAVVIIHHTARGSDHGRGSTVIYDDSDCTVVQSSTGDMSGEFMVDKHKSEPSGTTYPIALESVPVTLPGGSDVDVAGRVPTTLVAHARDPLTTTERAEQTRSRLDPNDALLVAVVEDNDGPPLSPAEVHRRAVERGYAKTYDTAKGHLQGLAERHCFTEHVAANGRRTYTSAVTTDSSPVDG